MSYENHSLCNRLLGHAYELSAKGFNEIAGKINPNSVDAISTIVMFNVIPCRQLKGLIICI